MVNCILLHSGSSRWEDTAIGSVVERHILHDPCEFVCLRRKTKIYLIVLSIKSILFRGIHTIRSLFRAVTSTMICHIPFNTHHLQICLTVPPDHLYIDCNMKL